MTIQWLRCRSLIVLIAIIIPAIARAQTLADRVPADTILYLGWSGVEKPAPGFAGSNWEAVLGDSSLDKVSKEFIPKLLDRIAAENKDAADAVEIVRELLGPMWRHPSAIAFAGVDFANANGPQPHFVLISDAGDEAATFKTTINNLLAKAGPAPFAVNVYQDGTLVGVTLGYADPTDGILKPAADAKSLANDPGFAKALAQVKKDAVVTGYVNFSGLVGLANTASSFGGDDGQKNWNKARDLLGLTGIKQVIWTAGFDGKDWMTQAFVDAPAPRKGIIGSMIDSAPLSQEILTAIPKDATVAGGADLDLVGLLTAVQDGVKAFAPDVAGQFDDVLKQINSAVDFDLQKDLLAALGDEWVYYTDPTISGNGPLGAIIVNRLRDSAKAEASLDKLQQFINTAVAQQLKSEKGITIAFRKAKIGDVTVRYLGIPLITPAWTIADGNLYLALYPEFAAAGASVLTNRDSPIFENQDFMGLYHRVGEHQASSFQFLDLPRLAPMNYGSWLAMSHLSGIGDLLGVPAPLGILPPLGKLLPNLSPAGQVAWADPDGLHFTSVSPFPGSELLASDPLALSAAQAPAMISVLLPALQKAREQAEHAREQAQKHPAD